jgi:hypothetical protein
MDAMDAPSPALVVNSLAEASLYLMLTRCRSCGEHVDPVLTRGSSEPGAIRLEVPVVCRACAHPDLVRFDLQRVGAAEVAMGLSGWAEAAARGEAPPINPRPEPSRLIDVAGWCKLHMLLVSAGARARSDAPAAGADRLAARQMEIQAGQCLEEALKFFEPGEQLPPPGAFFSERSRREFREHPELFLRERLVSLRAALPVAWAAGQP